MWENMVERGRAQVAIWRVRIACWIPKATNTHSEYVIFIAFPLQQWLHARALTLRYTCIAGLVYRYVYLTFMARNVVLRHTGTQPDSQICVFAVATY
jgi:hypothetical protein